MYISSYVVHRDPRFHDEPETFRPERFEPGWDKNIPRFAYFPFGGGPRICIGQSFAEMEAKLVLATLLPQIQFSLVGEEPIQLEPAATLRPVGGLPVKVVKTAV